MPKRHVVPAAALLVLLAAPMLSSGPPTSAHGPAQSGAKRADVARLLAVRGARRAYPRPVFARQKLDEPPARHASTWRERRRALYRDALASRRPEILILPFEVQAHPIDKVGRSLMARALGRELRRRTRHGVSDFDTVDRALGPARDRYLDTELRELLETAAPATYVRGYVGYEELGAMDVTLVVWERRDDSPLRYAQARRKTWRELRFDERTYPHRAFDGILSEAVRLVAPRARAPRDGAEDQPDAAGPPPTAAEAPALPSTPGELAAGTGKSAVQRAFELQLLGILSPMVDARERHRLFERSLMLARDMPATAPRRALLEARALLYLARRPAALEALGEVSTTTERALRQYADGDLAGMTKTVEEIEPTFEKLLARIELYDLATRFRQGDRLAPDWESEFFKRYPQWIALVRTKLNEWDTWLVESNAAVKRELDVWFPRGELSLETVLARVGIGQEPRAFELAVTRALHAHVEHALRAVPVGAGERERDLRHELLHLLEGIAQANAVKNTMILLDFKRDAEAALALVEGYLDIYEGHPELLLHAFRARRVLWRDADEEERRELAARVPERIEKIVELSYEQDAEYYRYRDVIRLFLKALAGDDYLERDEVEALVERLGHHDMLYPPRGASAGGLDAKLRYLAHTHDDFRALVNAYRAMRRSSEGDAQALIERNRHRFVGHPDRLGFLAEVKTNSGDARGLLAYYREAVERGSVDWLPYFELARNHALAGDYAEARAVFERYPPFDDASDGPDVGLANRAYRAASMLYSRGAYREAAPLFERAASAAPESEAGMASLARLATIAARYEVAARHHRQRSETYTSAYGFAEYLSFLHLLGRSDEAWSLFDSLIVTHDLPALWTSALVGHRVAATGEESLRAWLAERGAAAQEHRLVSMPARLAALALTMDRPPNDSAPRIIHDLARSHHWSVAPANGNSAAPPAFIVNARGQRRRLGAFFPPGDTTLATGDVVESEFAVFARAYNAIKRKRFGEAYRSLLELNRLYRPGEHPTFDYAFPYLARAAVESGHGAIVERALDWGATQGIARKTTSGSFYFRLATAFVEARSANHDAAVEHLDNAFRIRPPTWLRPVMSWYQIVEACLWLYEDSGDRRYRDLALRWSRSHQVVAPMHAWAYAVEARYAPPSPRRLPVLAMALHLDRESRLLEGIPEAEKHEARVWFEANDPLGLSTRRSERSSRRVRLDAAPG